MSTSEKVEVAFEMFEKNAANLKSIMKQSDYCCLPYPNEENYISVPGFETPDLASADEFFNMVEAYLENADLGTDGLNLSASALMKECRKEFETIVTGNGVVYQYCGIYYIHVALAVGVACYYFLSNETEMFLMFDRDKWESRGDYCSSSKAAIQISSEVDGCKTFAKKCKAYSNY